MSRPRTAWILAAVNVAAGVFLLVAAWSAETRAEAAWRGYYAVSSFALAIPLFRLRRLAYLGCAGRVALLITMDLLKHSLILALAASACLAYLLSSGVRKLFWGTNARPVNLVRGSAFRRFMNEWMEQNRRATEREQNRWIANSKNNQVDSPRTITSRA